MSPPVLRSGWTRCLAGAALAGTLAAGAPAPPQTPELESLLQRAHQGDVSAQIRLGQRYWRGEGVERSEIEAAKWFRKAAEQGEPRAQLSLGHLLIQGQFRIVNSDGRYQIEKDEAEGAKWIRKAAEQGHASAQFSLGHLYAQGQGVESDEVEAAKWIRKAAEQGHAIAQAVLAMRYFDGQGVEKDAAAAEKWARKAARQGKTFAFDVIGLGGAETRSGNKGQKKIP